MNNLSDIGVIKEILGRHGFTFQNLWDKTF